MALRYAKVHEFGAPSRGIPARPHFSRALKDSEEWLDLLAEGVLDSAAKKAEASVTGVERRSGKMLEAMRKAGGGKKVGRR
jgi:hypothetical protein